MCVIRTALSVGKHFAGRAVACTLSMGACDLTTLEVPLGSEAEQRSVIIDNMQGFAERDGNEREFDFWPTNIPSEEPLLEAEQVTVLSVSQPWVARVADEGHNLSRGGALENRLERLRLIRDWFDRHLTTEEA